MRGIFLALAGGTASGVLFAALATGTFGAVMFAYLSQVPLFLVGLGMGLPYLIVAGAAALLVAAVASSVSAAGTLAAIGVLPVLVLVRQALLNRPAGGGRVEWYPADLLLGWLVAMGAASIVIAGLYLSGHPDGTEAAVRTMLANALETMAPPQSLATGQVDAISTGFAAIFLGSMALSWMLMMAVNGSLAQGVLVGFGRNLRPSPDIAEVTVQRWIYFAFGAALLISIAAGGTLGYIARNLAIAFAVAFFFQGLGTIHALVRRWSARTVSLIVLYLVLIVFGWPVLIVTALGMAEPFLRLRARFGSPDRGKEE